MKYLTLLGLLTLPLVKMDAQDLAPTSIANHAASYSTVDSSGGAATVSTGLFTAGQSFKLSTAGTPLTNPMSFTWTKTGPTTGTLIERDGARTLTTAVTFTGPLTAAIRTTSNASTATQSGTAVFAPVPQPGPPLLNISTRANLGVGQGLNPGFVVGGTVPRRVLIRAVGPTLANAPFNVRGVMEDPSLTIFQGNTQIGFNNDWGGGNTLIAVFAAVGAFPLPLGSLDSAVVLTLAPGAYTAQVKGTGAGEVIVEVYFVD